jgi:hypothetical protein
MNAFASKILVGPLSASMLIPVACAPVSELPGDEGGASASSGESVTSGDAEESTTEEPEATDGSGDPQDTQEGTDTTDGDACEAAGLTIGAVGADAPMGFDGVFDREGRVWGLHLYATAGVSEANLQHATHLLAQYIDNDEDCEPDDASVLSRLQANKASMVIFASEADFENNIDVLEGAFATHGLQDLYDFETHPNGAAAGQFDAALEEVLHLVTHYGWSQAYPGQFAERNSSMAGAMDAARGGHFESIPAMYPEQAWYHYDDSTCDYECMATEYFYWSLTSLLGGQDFGTRCAEIANEWEACTAQQFETMDVAMHQLLTGEGYALPTVLPDGSYEPSGD